ncbi:hypothetical protein PCL_00877 [Purpureocillium lilacinum]|uniref:Uncharacterized protein n=2 Tax=Purpureocillium lilacinum TaxID=33203 RepID=A0A2U3E400_PURLI|nr:hypothetical protein PCL_00877 [Purpureocillium lilacinum]
MRSSSTASTSSQNSSLSVLEHTTVWYKSFFIMQLESIILCALAAVVGAAPLDDMEQGRRGSEPAPAAWSDYAIVPMTWDVKVRPDEESIQLEGTAQEVYRRLVELNPNYDVDFANATSADDAGEGELQRRTDFRNSNIICSDRSPPYAPFGRMDARSYYEANNYLGRLKGSPTLDAGPRVCGRVSCSYDGAVYVCNDAGGGREPGTTLQQQEPTGMLEEENGHVGTLTRPRDDNCGLEVPAVTRDTEEKEAERGALGAGWMDGWMDGAVQIAQAPGAAHPGREIVAHSGRLGGRDLCLGHALTASRPLSRQAQAGGRTAESGICAKKKRAVESRTRSCDFLRGDWLHSKLHRRRYLLYSILKSVPRLSRQTRAAGAHGNCTGAGTAVAVGSACMRSIAFLLPARTERGRADQFLPPALAAAVMCRAEWKAERDASSRHCCPPSPSNTLMQTNSVSPVAADLLPGSVCLPACLSRVSRVHPTSLRHPPSGAPPVQAVETSIHSSQVRRRPAREPRHRVGVADWRNTLVPPARPYFEKNRPRMHTPSGARRKEQGPPPPPASEAHQTVPYADATPTQRNGRHAVRPSRLPPTGMVEPPRSFFNLVRPLAGAGPCRFSGGGEGAATYEEGQTAILCPVEVGGNVSPRRGRLTAAAAAATTCPVRTHRPPGPMDRQVVVSFRCGSSPRRPRTHPSSHPQSPTTVPQYKSDGLLPTGDRSDGWLASLLLFLSREFLVV